MSGNLACESHCAGIMASGVGRFYLGLPRGFCRLGNCDETKIHLFENIEKGWEYNKFNVPLWKHLDKHGNTIVRGMCPRLNYPWIHIYLGDYLENIDCLEITQEDIERMD